MRDPVLVVVMLAAAAVASLRWLRVAQREHYHPGSVTLFARRWFVKTTRANAVLFALMVVAVVVALWWPWSCVVVAVLVAALPLGLGLRGRSSPLRWTTRLKTLAAVLSGVWLLLVIATVSVDQIFVLTLPLLMLPYLVDLALWLCLPLERRKAKVFLTRAQLRLNAVSPEVVAITGSYGKTSTKEYVQHLLTGTVASVASPASFNNLAGLSRTINEHLAPGTDVLVAEVGTYGPGEIREICAWLKPTISVVTVVGPVHLERMGSTDNIARAKSEIFDTADVAIVNAASPHVDLLTAAVKPGARLVQVGGQSGTERTRAWHDETGRVVVSVDDVEIATIGGGATHATNVACAVAVALELGVPVDRIAQRLHSLPVPAHRSVLSTLPSGVRIIDDTYNANPAGAAAALRQLTSLEGPGLRVLVTPGMVELGPQQDEANREFAAAAAARLDHVLVVGRTNRRSLVDGATGGRAQVHVVADREAAVAWVRATLGPGDAVLYENDLPDHYA